MLVFSELNEAVFYYIKLYLPYCLGALKQSKRGDHTS